MERHDVDKHLGGADSGSRDAQSGEEPAAELRRRAEHALPFDVQQLRKLDDTDIMALLHELQVHQVELEMQNEGLRRAQPELQVAAERFASLYDLAPVGYLTLDEDGRILETNTTFTRQLRMERGRGGGWIELEVVDDGVGFDAGIEYPGYGLRSMRDRVARLGGTFELTSRPGNGTALKVRIPAQAEG